MRDTDEQRHGSDGPDGLPGPAQPVGWLSTAAGQALRKRIAVQLDAETRASAWEVGAGGCLTVTFEVGGLAFLALFPHDFPEQQPLLRWREGVAPDLASPGHAPALPEPEGGPPAPSPWSPSATVEPPEDALTVESRAFAFLEHAVPQLVAAAARRPDDAAPEGPALEASKQPSHPPAPPRARGRHARRLGVETVVISQPPPLDSGDDDSSA
jgi:hypothetical protein